MWDRGRQAGRKFARVILADGRTGADQHHRGGKGQAGDGEADRQHALGAEVGHDGGQHRRGGGGDDALRQGEAAHHGAELGAAEQGQRQGGAQHRLQAVGDAVGHDADQRDGDVAAGQPGEAEAYGQRGGREQGRTHDRIAMAEREFHAAHGDLGRADQRGQHQRGGGVVAEAAQHADGVHDEAGEDEGAAREGQRQQPEGARAFGRRARTPRALPADAEPHQPFGARRTDQPPRHGGQGRAQAGADAVRRNPHRGVARPRVHGGSVQLDVRVSRRQDQAVLGRNRVLPRAAQGGIASRHGSGRSPEGGGRGQRSCRGTQSRSQAKPFGLTEKPCPLKQPKNQSHY